MNDIKDLDPVVAALANGLARQALLSPQPWEEGGDVHNWRNYVGPQVRALWETFSPVQKLAIYRDADEKAGNEEWD